jgi:hypothetical protein
MALAAEFLVLVLVICLVGFVIWKLALSKIPAIRMALKLSKIEEIDSLSSDASNVDVGKVKQRKHLLTEFEKEDL